MTRTRCAFLAATALATTTPQAGWAQSSATYTYDALGRVVGTSYPSGSSTTYTYDAADNRKNVTTTVVGGNHPPVANNDTASVTAGNTVTINAIGNDSDPDGDPLTITSVGTPSKGTASIVSNKINYTAGSSQSGTDSFGYSISDGKGGTASATITVTISAACTPPSPQNTSATVAFDSANNSLPVSISGGAASSLSISTSPAHGTASVNGLAISYTPTNGYSGSDSLAYRANGCSSSYGPATISITVNPNHPPVAVADSITTNYQTAITFNPLTNDYDPDGDPIQIQAVNQGAHGSVTFTPSTITYTPAAGFSGSDSFGYSINDGKGGAAYASISATVNPPTPTVVANADSLTIHPTIAYNGSGVTYTWSGCLNVLSNDTGQNLAVTSVSPGTYVSSWAANGQVCFYTQSNPSMNYTYTYSISGTGGTSSSTIALSLPFS